jgi:tRNA threonylcarbamoyladenosine biosynthesis protein TsaB
VFEESAMKTLAIDTSGKAAGIAILSDSHILYEIYIDTGLNHSLVLLPELDKALHTLKLELKDLDLYVTTTGPGSFTGLRIGLSTLKGFAISQNKPLVGVSTLEALAHNICAEDVFICPILNGPMEEIYTALYRYHDNADYEVVLKDQITDIPTLIKHISGPVIFLGDGATRWQGVLLDLLPDYARFATETLHICRASVIASVGLEKYRKHETEDMISLIPTYLRVSEAELKKAGD